MKNELDIKLQQLAEGLELTLPANRANTILQMLEIAIVKYQRYDEHDIYEMKRMDKNFTLENKLPEQLYLPFVTNRRRRKTDG